MPEIGRSRGVAVAAAGTGVNLALGVLYAWSVIKGGIPDTWGWSNAHKAMPYAVACLVFALAMTPAGRLQDRIGPRWVATIGGLLTGLGCIVAALSGASLTGFVLGFGLLAGTGIGFGYSAATPAAIKWFPPQKTGLVTGIVVAGFGLASVYIAPLATFLLDHFARRGPTGVLEKGVSSTMLLLGVGFLVVVIVLSQLLRNPPSGYAAAPAGSKASSARPPASDHGARAMLRSPQFYVLWLMYFAGAAAGLTFISVAQGLGKRSLGELAFLVVVVLAVGNAGGRVVAGLVSDRIGRLWTVCGVHVLQAGAVLLLYFVKGGASWPVILALVCLIGANYGSNLSLFPAASKDLFGLKNFGLNYGILFSAWGAAGLTMPWVNGAITDATGGDGWTYLIIVGLLLLGAGLTFASRALGARAAAEAAAAPDSAAASLTSGT
jgi:MFS transporter, OFA family, oxalate/formate antiporter